VCKNWARSNTGMCYNRDPTWSRQIWNVIYITVTRNAVLQRILDTKYTRSDFSSRLTQSSISRKKSNHPMIDDIRTSVFEIKKEFENSSFCFYMHSLSPTWLISIDLAFIERTSPRRVIEAFLASRGAPRTWRSADYRACMESSSRTGSVPLHPDSVSLFLPLSLSLSFSPCLSLHLVHTRR